LLPGKSTWAYACTKAGWTYVADDGSFLVHEQDDYLVAGNCHQIGSNGKSQLFALLPPGLRDVHTDSDAVCNWRPWPGMFAAEVSEQVKCLANELVKR
jgi:hypothetical protein